MTDRPPDSEKSSSHSQPLDPRLVDRLYDDLRAAAGRHLATERANHTLSATALVHEAYLRIAGPRQVPLRERAHFYATAVEAMRRVLLDHAKARGRQKRGRGQSAVPLDAVLDLADMERCDDYLELDEAITALAVRDPRLSEIVRLRFFAGLSVAEVATVLGVSERTVKSDWAFARAWLARQLGGEPM